MKRSADKKNIIGSRGSDLALWQANYVLAALEDMGVEAEIRVITTKGDQIQDIGFDKMEGKGFFTKEIEEALINKEIDLAVHSHKDLETNQPTGLKIAAVPKREDPSELLLIRNEALDIKLKFSLKARAVVGTSSARRKTQLLSFRDDIQLKDLRGNVPTRIQKLRDGEYDAIMLAAAGVKRLELNLTEFHTEYLDAREFISAPAQGALAMQIREEDAHLADILQGMKDAETSENTAIERKVLNLFDGGCQLPLGVYCIKEQGRFRAWASVASSWDSFPKRVYLESKNAEELPFQIVEKLKEQRKESVFISREIKEDGYFKKALEANGCEVIALPLTTFRQVEFGKVPETDWIFFSSKNCVKYFFSQNPKIRTVKFGTIGAATDAALRRQGFVSDFRGSSTDTIEIGKDFAELLGNESVLFPQSSSSYRTVQKQFSDQAGMYDLVVYESVENKEAEIPHTDVVVLTSPSNVISYLRKKKISPEQKIIAMGNSTGKKLEEHGIMNYHLPWSSSVIALADTVLSI